MDNTFENELEFKLNNQEVIKQELELKDESETKEQILVRMQGELDTKGQDLIKMKNELEIREQDLVRMKDELEIREQALIIMKDEVETKEQNLVNTTKKLETKKQEITNGMQDLVNRNQELDSKEIELRSKRQVLEAKEQQLSKQEEEIERSFYDNSKRYKEILDKENELKEKQRRILQKETYLEEELLKKRNDVELELLNKRKEYEQALIEEREKCRKDMNQTFKQIRTEFDRRMDKEYVDRQQEIERLCNDEKNKRHKMIDDEIISKRKMIDNEVTLKNKKIVEKEEVLRQMKENLEKEQEVLDTERNRVQIQKRRNERKEAELEEQEEELNELIVKKIEDKIHSYEEAIIALKNENNELRMELKNANKEIASLQTIRIAYGEDPTIIRKKIQDFEYTIEQLQEELVSRPEATLKERFDQIKLENNVLKSDIANLRQQNQALIKGKEEIDTLEIKNQSLLSERENLKSHIEELENECEKFRMRISRLASIEGRLSDREDRIKEIKSGYIKNFFNSPMAIEQNEVMWLESIRRSCRDYGISFPKRILYAFHTALKISDWSSVTVLAGVSGTGKSELPRLYSAFGGLNFINVPVQPNWDSQESMLGFFNSIDNRFDPQPLLKFLVECTEDQTYSNYMSIVLLDEMNLAHVEHYFAEFLSKLESRRGTSRDTVPTIEVKLGAGVEPYQLKLSRNVLWAGTMNQDETTKSLSDKVLDRGIVINFPRPRSLSSRKNMGMLQSLIEQSNRPMLPKKVWGKWVVREIDFVGDQLDELIKYRTLVEDINDALESVGRALGHRVWQSIEYYIANYPLVIAAKNEAVGELTGELREAMKIAFEDQIVQKIMPKLRGIETRGKGGENLNDIKDLLDTAGFEKLKDDFEIACEQGYGQFMWTSAKYIEIDEEGVSE